MLARLDFALLGCTVRVSLVKEEEEEEEEE